MQKALYVRLTHTQAAFDMRHGQEQGVEAEFDSQIIAMLVLESRAEARKSYGSRQQLPFAFVLPQVPERIDFDGTIGLHELKRGFENRGRLGVRQEFTLEQRRLGIGYRVNSQNRTALGQLGEREPLQHLFEVAQGVAFRETANPAR